MDDSKEDDNYDEKSNDYHAVTMRLKIMMALTIGDDDGEVACVRDCCD